MLRKAGKEAFGYTCDLSNREEVYKVSKQIIQEHGPITMLINNAGIVSGADLLDTADCKLYYSQEKLQIKKENHKRPKCGIKELRRIFSYSSQPGLEKGSEFCREFYAEVEPS